MIKYKGGITKFAALLHDSSGMQIVGARIIVLPIDGGHNDKQAGNRKGAHNKLECAITRTSFAIGHCSNSLYFNLYIHDLYRDI